MAGKVTIDRLALRLTGLGPDDARRLAVAVAGKLADARAGGDRVRVTVAAGDGEGGIDALAQQIAAAVGRRLGG